MFFFVIYLLFYLIETFSEYVIMEINFFEIGSNWTRLDYFLEIEIRRIYGKSLCYKFILEIEIRRIYRKSLCYKFVLEIKSIQLLKLLTRNFPPTKKISNLFFCVLYDFQNFQMK